MSPPRPNSPWLFAGAVALGVLFAGCPTNPEPQPDAGTQDSGAPLACDSPEDCKAAGFDGVCRDFLCNAQVPCGDDAECGIGESCESGLCRFTGCTQDTDCAVGKCRTDVYACTECSENADCPDSNPVCSPKGHCVSCQSDTDCRYPGPAYCDAPSGACVHCKNDDQCPLGLKCDPKGVCYGAQINQACSTGVACDLGLTCVNVGQNTLCLEACNLYVPSCPTGQICIKLTFQDSPSLVFDQGAPVGVCYNPVQGLKGYHEPCSGNCQPNLECVPDSASQSTCKAYCDPSAPACAPNEKCHAFPGDWNGHQYGLCYPDTGYGDVCTAETCDQGLACVPRDDPSTSTELSNFCAFNAGSGAGLSPCTQNTQCRSGACRGDPKLGTSPFFCFAACANDADCALDGRTGYCDGKFEFSTKYVTNGLVTGCRPHCSGPAECAAYGSVAPQCQLLLDTSTGTPRAQQTCGPTIGAGAAGTPCSSDLECASNFCFRRDGRAQMRQGVCSNPCASAGECGPLACESTTLFVNAGTDGLPNTSDDKLALTSVCAAGGCTTNAGCAGTLSECVPQPDPQSPLSNLVTTCRAPSLYGSKAGGAACTSDSECESAVCAEVGAGPNKACLQLCTVGGSDCATGLTCAGNGVRVRRGDGSYQSFDACLP